VRDSATDLEIFHWLLEQPKIVEALEDLEGPERYQGLVVISAAS
jgi:hypothetical protein